MDETPGDELVGLAANPPRGAVTIHRRDITTDDFAGAAIAVGAFADDGNAEKFAATARAHGVPVNVIDKPAFCDFAFGAIVNRSPLASASRPMAPRRCSAWRCAPRSRP
jgi:uroporphyrin-III C-methyltransferase/precorrin-2 dehydrogenase/sirohydrochlorin ferrochelatase